MNTDSDDNDSIPTLKQVLGALLYASSEPLTMARIMRVINEVKELHAITLTEEPAIAAIHTAVAALRHDLEQAGTGMTIQEIAGGFCLRNQATTAPWVRQHVERSRPSRLTKAALETLAVVAYRQPVSRPQIEAVRGVGVDSLLKKLLSLDMIAIVGQSDLPGHPSLYGTTKNFLEHFGLSDITELPGRDDWRNWNQQVMEWHA